jgi:uncharacterized phiE125 gp8 family phage protein
MNLVCYSPPATEPATLAELKRHLILDSETLAGNMTLNISILGGSHPVVTGYTLLGTAVDVIGKESLVYLQSFNNGAGGTVDAKIQECDTSTGTFTDWVGGAFTQVTEANDTVIQEKQYTGTKQWIRVVAKTLVAASEFGAVILVNAATTPEDDLLADLIIAAREIVEDVTRRKLITQTWDYYPDCFPLNQNFMKVPFGNLQSVTNIKYKDSAGTETTLTAGTDYLVETNGDQHGRIVLPYGCSWPSVTLYPSNPIAIRFICGWLTAADVPRKYKTAIKMQAADMFLNRESTQNQEKGNISINPTVDLLLGNNAKLWGEF